MAGLIDVARQAFGGNRVSMTQKLRNQYTKQVVETQSDGGEAPAWEEWVKQQGYRLDGNGLVVAP